MGRCKNFLASEFRRTAPQLRMLRKTLDIVDDAKGYPGGAQEFSERRPGPLREGLGDQAVGLRPVGDPGSVRGKAHVASQIRLFQNPLCQQAPFAVGLDRYQQQIAVLGRECTIRRDRRMREAHPLGRSAEIIVVQQGHSHPFRHCVEQ